MAVTGCSAQWLARADTLGPIAALQRRASCMACDYVAGHLDPRDREGHARPWGTDRMGPQVSVHGSWLGRTAEESVAGPKYGEATQLAPSSFYFFLFSSLIQIQILN